VIRGSQTGVGRFGEKEGVLARPRPFELPPRGLPCAPVHRSETASGQGRRSQSVRRAHRADPRGELAAVARHRAEEWLPSQEGAVVYGAACPRSSENLRFSTAAPLTTSRPRGGSAHSGHACSERLRPLGRFRHGRPRSRPTRGRREDGKQKKTWRSCRVPPAPIPHSSFLDEGALHGCSLTRQGADLPDAAGLAELLHERKVVRSRPRPRTRVAPLAEPPADGARARMN